MCYIWNILRWLCCHSYQRRPANWSISWLKPKVRRLTGRSRLNRSAAVVLSGCTYLHHTHTHIHTHTHTQHPQQLSLEVTTLKAEEVKLHQTHSELTQSSQKHVEEVFVAMVMRCAVMSKSGSIYISSLRRTMTLNTSCLLKSLPRMS